MSILIKGMEMPRDGELLYLKIYPDGKVTIDGDLKCKQIATAIPVSPHGRLIDVDSLFNSLQEIFDRAEENARFTGERGESVTWDNAIYYLKTAPTIIEAE